MCILWEFGLDFFLISDSEPCQKGFEWLLFYPDKRISYKVLAPMDERDKTGIKPKFLLTISFALFLHTILPGSLAKKVKYHFSPLATMGKVRLEGGTQFGLSDKKIIKIIVQLCTVKELCLKEWFFSIKTLNFTADKSLAMNLTNTVKSQK